MSEEDSAIKITTAVNELKRLEKRRIIIYWVCIAFLVLLCVLSVINGFSPCEKCRLKVERQGFTQEYTCYDLAKEKAEGFANIINQENKNKPVPMPTLNITLK